MLQPAFVVPEKRGGFLIHGAQLVVWEVRNTSVPGEGTQVYVNGDVRTANEIAYVVDALRPHSLHRAQSGAIDLMIEPGVKVLAGIDPVGSEEVGDGVSLRDLLCVVELHGHGKVCREEPALKSADCPCISPAQLQMEKPRSESPLVVAPWLEADVADDSTHVGPSARLEKRSAAKKVSNVVGEPLGRVGCEHGLRMALPSSKLVGKFITLEWMEQGAVPSCSSLHDGKAGHLGYRFSVETGTRRNS
ncbi:hypothetical protein [Streptomyces sp. NBC_01363]|uniref:hypothetical protein n=1 Tax=Streptomyces sp. NBC_01363 TaxID=2903840 RepID=UPI00224DC2DD|nr:hypothetical protein [Streptomyces sp. NBC_01363]MCX4735352.1 hypothetical protein [Streptomyces sp. NBC_01363]